MQGTVVMLLALSGLGCHHKKSAPVYVETSYSSCYTDGCYSSCYSGTGCYSSCYSGAAYSPAEYSCYSCYSSCYSAPRHRHGLFGCKRRSCAACCAPAPAPPVCDPCGFAGGGLYSGPGFSDLPVYGTYTPVYQGYSQGQYIGSTQTYSAPAAPPATPAAKPADAAPTTPEAPSPGNPAPTPAPPTPVTPAPTTTTPPTPPPAG
jgi:hypothetical protein